MLRVACVTLLVCSSTWWCGVALGQCSGGATDMMRRGDMMRQEQRQDKLALYKITLRTFWSRARFPKHYPEWKPPAQFGKLIGKF